MELKRSLFPHQIEAVDFCLKNKYSILALYMGLGKSLTAIAVKAKTNSRCLIVCPAYLLLNWKSEIEKSLDGQVITIFKSSKDFYYPIDSDFVLVSYDLAVKFEDIWTWTDLVVLDEANHIQSMSAKRTSAIHRLIFENSIKRVMLLTGTPIKNRIKEYYSLIALCNYNPDLKNKSQFLDKYSNDVDFADRFSNRHEFTMNRGHRYFTVVNWDGLRNEEELRSWLKPIYFSRKAEYPPTTYLEVVVDDYDDKEIREHFKNFVNGVSKVAPQVKAVAALRKAEYTVKYVKDKLDNGEITRPIVVFTDHRESCAYLAEALGGTMVTGEISGIRRGQIADSFQRGSIDIIVATYGSFSTGYNLVRSNTIIENDFPWVPGILEQAEGRINRTGQLRPCFVHRMIGSEQDKYILKVLTQKSDVIRKIF